MNINNGYDVFQVHGNPRKKSGLEMKLNEDWIKAVQLKLVNVILQSIACKVKARRVTLTRYS